jgi:hypothetical protein
VEGLQYWCIASPSSFLSIGVICVDGFFFVESFRYELTSDVSRQIDTIGLVIFGNLAVEVS